MLATASRIKDGDHDSWVHEWTVTPQAPFGRPPSRQNSEGADRAAALTPVLDAMLERPEVDPDRVAVIGISQAGYWVPRALAFEHRFAAAVVDPGVVDVSTSWLATLSDPMREQLQKGDRTAKSSTGSIDTCPCR